MIVQMNAPTNQLCHSRGGHDERSLAPEMGSFAIEAFKGSCSVKETGVDDRSGRHRGGVLLDKEGQNPDPMGAVANETSATRLSAEQRVWKKFRESGINVRSWALERGFNPGLVYSVLRGERKCLRGQSHDVAVALGLKP